MPQPPKPAEITINPDKSESMSFEGHNINVLQYFKPNEDTGEEGRLIAVFRGGATYEYSAVPDGIWLRLIQEVGRGTLGAGFHKWVRSQSFSYRRIDGDVPLDLPGIS